MKTSDRGRALIRAHEGLRLEAYPDPAHGWSIPTIGYGHTSAAGPPKVERGMRITETGADEILRTDLRKFEDYVNSYVRVPLNQNQFDALVSFTFNVGPGNLKSSTLLRRLNGGEYSEAADQFLRWDKAGGKAMPGLTKRRAAERALFLEPVTSSRPEPKPEPARPAPKPIPSAPAPVAPPSWGWIAGGLIVAAIAASMVLGG